MPVTSTPTSLQISMSGSVMIAAIAAAAARATICVWPGRGTSHGNVATGGKHRVARLVAQVNSLQHLVSGVAAGLTSRGGQES